MTSNRRKIQYRNRSYWVTIPPAMAADKRIEPESQAEWRSFPLATIAALISDARRGAWTELSDGEWRRMQREYPNALVLIPREQVEAPADCREVSDA